MSQNNLMGFGPIVSKIRRWRWRYSETPMCWASQLANLTTGPLFTFQPTVKLPDVSDEQMVVAMVRLSFEYLATRIDTLIPESLWRKLVQFLTSQLGELTNVNDIRLCLMHSRGLFCFSRFSMGFPPPAVLATSIWWKELRMAVSTLWSESCVMTGRDGRRHRRRWRCTDCSTTPTSWVWRVTPSWSVEESARPGFSCPT